MPLPDAKVDSDSAVLSVIWKMMLMYWKVLSLQKSISNLYQDTAYEAGFVSKGDERQFSVRSKRANGMTNDEEKKAAAARK